MSELIGLLVDPSTMKALRLRGDELVEENGSTYPIIDGIPRFVAYEDAGQVQTSSSFGFKWSRRDTYDSPEMAEMGRRWWAERYGAHDISELTSFFRSRRLILDAGCGSGLGTSFWMPKHWERPPWIGVDISRAIDVARERLGSRAATHFVQADVMQLPFPDETFDTVIAEGVLHHTPSTESAFRSAVRVLERGGEFRFYIYRRKGPLREFADDYIRQVVSELPPDEAWDALRPLTKLAQALSELSATVEVEEDVPYLGITAGRHDVQRLMYWNLLKLYWNPTLSFEENNHINFDWYHPRYAYRHTREEIQRWCEECDLDTLHFGEQESGFTVRAVKR